jgi:deoxyadenosine/deoxycytidine kinase
MPRYFIVVAGNIGSGKTSLTRLMSARLGWDAFYESVDDNPYLADFYADMRAWSFHLQVFFLGHRARMHRHLSKQHENSSILDRSIYEDAEIFARALHELGNLNDRDLNAYRSVYDQVINYLPAPSLLIYLRTTVPTLMERIQKRARGIETGITADYLSLLNSYYEQWLEHFDLCPVLSIPSDELNFVAYDDHLTIIVNRVLDRLKGKEEIQFQ